MDWDPSHLLFHPDRTGSELSPLCIIRIRRDLKSIILEPPPGIFVAADESNVTLVHALVIGPSDTPYENGFFYFIIGFPSDYPIKPPKVKLMTTGGSKVRFNPNLYKEGKVCLSILGTWSGPAWSPAHSLTSVLLSIQSLLNDKPYHNEPGYDTMEATPGDVERYNEVVRHETLRVAVLGMLDNDFGINIPPSLVDIMQKHFLQSYEFYVTLVNSKLDLTNKQMQDPFGSNNGVFRYAGILERLKDLYHKFKTDNTIGSSSSSVNTLMKTLSFNT